MNPDMSDWSEQGRVATGSSADISAWLVKEGLRGATQTSLLEGFCERLVAAGIHFNAHTLPSARSTPSSEP